jgi:hypothetical protein
MGDFSGHHAVDEYLKKQANICVSTGSSLGLKDIINAIKGISFTCPINLMLYDYSQYLPFETKGKLIERVNEIIEKAKILHSEGKYNCVKEDMAIKNMAIGTKGQTAAPPPMNKNAQVRHKFF